MQGRLFQSFNRNKSLKKSLTPLFQPQQLPDSDFNEDDKPFAQTTDSNISNQIPNLSMSPSLKARFKGPSSMPGMSSLKSEYKPDFMQENDFETPLSDNDVDDLLSLDNCSVPKKNNSLPYPKGTPLSKLHNSLPQTPDEHKLNDFVTDIQTLMMKKNALEDAVAYKQSTIDKQTEELASAKKTEIKAVEFINEFQDSKSFYNDRLNDLESLAKVLTGISKFSKDSCQELVAKQIKIENELKMTIQELNKQVSKMIIDKQDIEKMLIDTNTKLATSQTHSQSIIDQLQASKVVVDDLNTKLVAMGKENTNYAKELALSLQEIESHKLLISNHNKQQQSLQNQLDNVNKENTAYQVDIKGLNQQLSSLQDKNDSLIAMTNQVNDKQEGLLIKLDQQVELNQSLEIKVASSNALVQSLQDKIKDIQFNGQESKVLSDKLQLLFNSILKLNAEKLELKETIDKMRLNQDQLLESFNNTNSSNLDVLKVDHEAYFFIHVV